MGEQTTEEQAPAITNAEVLKVLEAIRADVESIRFAVKCMAVAVIVVLGFVGLAVFDQFAKAAP